MKSSEIGCLHKAVGDEMVLEHTVKLYFIWLKIIVLEHIILNQINFMRTVFKLIAPFIF